MERARAGSGDARGRATAFGVRLRRLRSAAGMSQVALAGDELHPSYISLLEAGRRVPTPDALAVLARRLGMSVGELTGDIDHDLEGPLVLAEAALGLGRPGEAVTLLEPWSAGLTAERLSTSPLTFRAGEAYAAGLERVGRLDDAIRVLETLRTAVEVAAGNDAWLAVTVSLVRCYRDAGDVARAVDVGELAVSRLSGLASVRLARHAALVSTLAGAYAERGDLTRAAALLDDLLDETSGSGSPEQQAGAYWNAAITAAERGRPADGLVLADQATRLLALGDDLRSRARVQVAKARILLAQSPPRAAEARTLLRGTLPLLRQYDGSLGVASAETELARCELVLGRPDVALRHARSALRVLSIEHPVERARALTTLGSALLATGDRDAGLVALDESASCLERAQAPRQAAAVWRQLAEVFNSQGDVVRALAATERALTAVGLLAEPVTARPDAGGLPARRRRASTVQV
ncbi:MAG: helix-turn-helix transcriptional regulator [Actinomycetales bacterium]|nr:helix-turn-helix transcriptional regulator [Actinomycetales bacterium]